MVTHDEQQQTKEFAVCKRFSEHSRQPSLREYVLHLAHFSEVLSSDAQPLSPFTLFVSSSPV
jgi:hypothetical protein